MLGVASVNVSVSTIAARSAGATCIPALDPGAAQAVDVDSDAKLTINGCGIHLNSSSATARLEVDPNGATMMPSALADAVVLVK